MLLNKYFLIQDDKVINIIVYNGGQWSPPRGCFILPVPEDKPYIGIGWGYDKETGLFFEPDNQEEQYNNII